MNKPIRHFSIEKSVYPTFDKKEVGWRGWLMWEGREGEPLSAHEEEASTLEELLRQMVEVSKRLELDFDLLDIKEVKDACEKTVASLGEIA